MRNWRFGLGMIAVALLALGTMAGCVVRTPDDDTNPEDITGSEARAMKAAVAATSALAQSTDVTQTSTGDIDTEAKTRGSRQLDLPDITFGTCPEVTKTGSILEDDLTITIDFGDEPCTAFTADEEFTLVCSGSASGTVSATGLAVGLEFNDITCNDESLSGSANLALGLLVPGVSVEGDWDLTWNSDGDTVSTAGEGRGTYMPVLTGCCDITTIEEYTGTVSEQQDEWSLTMENVQISLEEYYCLVPFSGVVVVDGPAIRAMTITFSETSPTTGEITISIENGRTITTDLEQLEEWAEAASTE